VKCGAHFERSASQLRKFLAAKLSHCAGDFRKESRPSLDEKLDFPASLIERKLPYPVQLWYQTPFVTKA
jgi:hypothetical protein